MSFLWLLLLAIYASAEKLDEVGENKISDNVNRSKRLSVKQSSGRRWPKAILPYQIDATAMKDKPEIERVIAIFEDMSCVRIPHWNESVPKIYGLEYPGRMNLIKKHHMCFSYSTGYSKRPVNVSCCLHTSCMHEIGHMLGFYHEQSNPLKDGWTRSNWKNIWPAAAINYKKSESEDLDLTQPYDTSTIMHYEPWMFADRDGSVAVLFPELSIHSEYFYFFKELAHLYSCSSFPQCQGRTLKCENDGYQTILHGKCQCNCPTGLDPDTLCKTPLKKVTSAKWPKGQYALPMVKTGCPDNGSFQQGQMKTSSEEGNRNSVHMKGKTEGKEAEINFCTRTLADDDFKTEDEAKFNWPIGTFCIFKKGDECPSGFTSNYFDYKVESMNGTGELPDVSYNKNRVNIKMCCQYRGFTVDPVSFPTDKPFALIKWLQCQAVTGMVVQTEPYTITSSGWFTADKKTGLYLNHGARSMTIPLCYYTPTDMDCGGLITLTKSNPVATIEMSAKGRTNLECTWIIRGDNEKTTLVLDFDEFEVKKDGNSCSDRVEVRHSRIGQYGLKYCGQKPDHSIRSITNKFLVRFFTFRNSKSLFKATIKLTDFDDMCYALVGSRGLNYDGDVNYTRTFQPCLPWAEMSECYHHPFLEKDVFARLDGNACRNPDHSFRPWCYTDKVGCQRNYCDVCGIETPYDKLDFCGKLKTIGFCTTDSKLAVKYCPKTCFDQLPGNKLHLKKYTDITCGKPAVISDSDLVGNKKSRYKLGETIQYKCKKGPSFVTSRCLTSSHWSEVGSACLRCPIGFQHFDGICYKLMEYKATFDDAQSKCNSFTGSLASPKNPKENRFLLKLSKGLTIWLGIDDRPPKELWTHTDGTHVTWTNWEKGHPEKQSGISRCVWMRTKGRWASFLCLVPTRFVCAVPAFVFSGIKCVDILGMNCQKHLTDNPQLCEDFTDFAKQYCRRTCDFCRNERAKCNVQNGNPNVLTQTTQSTISVGEVVNYRCERFTYPTKGHGRRACLLNGKLSGEPLQCDECPLGFKIVNDACHGSLPGRILSFPDAQDECKKMDGFIALPKSKVENDIISSLGAGQRLWIGAIDDKHLEAYMWADGSPVKWTNWDNDEPKSTRGSNACVGMNEDKSWASINCNDVKMSTVCTIPKSGDTICYDRKDNGMTYAGQANVCINNTTCKTWAESRKCYQSMEKVFERYNLESNFCRNPDKSHRPWCYTDDDCSREDCNVCVQRNEIPPQNIMKVRCKRPSIPSDGEMVSVPRSSYRLGDEVAIKCKINEFQVTTTCLTSGHWSPLSTACTDCPVGYSQFENTCYGFVDKVLDYDKAVKECSKIIGGHLPRPKTLEENDFIKSLNRGKYTWFDARRNNDDNRRSFKYSDGTDVKWLTGKSSDFDCGFIDEHGTWGSTRCDFVAPLQNLICSVSKFACPPKYHQYEDRCYRFPKRKLKFLEARTYCERVTKGYIASPKSSQENDFLSRLSHGQTIWIGLNDFKTEGIWESEDGTEVTWTNWDTGEPNNFRDEDAGLLTPDKKWNDGDELRYEYFVCVTRNLGCYDFLEDQCVQLLEDKPTMCQDEKGFVSFYCAKTCGLCGTPGECNVTLADHSVVSTSKSTISVGQFIEYSCRTGTFAVDGGKKRACLPNGRLTGTAIECKDCPIGYKKFRNNCYGFIDKAVTFQDAVKECDKVNGFVASPKDKQENNFIPIVSNKAEVWLGLSFANETNDYRWQDRTKLDWSKWSDDKKDGVCVSMLSDGTWIRQSCDNELLKTKIVCEAPSLGDQTCYNTDDKGATYDGQVNVTIGLETCLPWAEAKNCPNSPFNKGNELKNLVENYCRNPDNSPGPWCYVNVGTCDKKYCAVCKHEKVKDYTTVSCKKPKPPLDGIIATPLKDSYKVGEKVDIACNGTNIKIPMTTTCLTSGQWSPVGRACTECPAGYSLFDEKCYGFVDEEMTYKDAENHCKKVVQGHIATPNDREENKFISEESQGKTIWIGLNNIKTDGTWVKDDGTLPSWTNWEPGEPNDWGKNGVVIMKPNKKWDDISESYKNPFVCAAPKQEPKSTICEDFLLDQCTVHLARNPDMCLEHINFASQFCEKSCKVCGKVGDLVVNPN